MTLTATEAGGRPNQQFAPPNPYSIITEPKRNRGPRSCPGGHGQYFGGDDSAESATNGPTNLDYSMEAHSAFIPSNNNQQHRRSSRRIVGGTVIGVGGCQDGIGHEQQQQIPFSEIGNGTGRHRREEESTSSSFGRYKNLPLVDQNQMRIREQQKELTELGFAYREERARRKALQRDLRREQQSKESLAMENFRLQSIISLLLRQQQQNTAANGSNPMVGIDLNTLFAAGLYQSSSWATNTPSSSSVIGHGPSAVGHGHHQIPSWATPNFPAVHNPNPPPPPFLGGLFPSGNVPPSTGQCECLAQPILSSSSLMNGAAALGDTRCHSLEQDEVKIFRNGQHTDSSFSGQSSRPTTGDNNEAAEFLVSEQSSRAQASFSSPEIGRSMESKEGNGTFCLHSFSLDGQRVKSVQLVEDIDRPICREDDGYATSETNISASICTTLGGQEMGEFNGKDGMKTNKFGAIRSMSAETI